ncbi:MAG TPA: class D sortase, partial [Thermoanaerobaculia bacterium]|nr:class D sortase [Thermoanaerobaculia bacterium]
LRRGAGRIPGTALPWEEGNVGVAAHRDRFFRGLKDIQKDDLVTLTTVHGTYQYRVESTEVVTPRDTHVLADTGEDTLTLVTCYPFYYVGSAPKRFIVRAQRIEGGETAGGVS